MTMTRSRMIDLIKHASVQEGAVFALRNQGGLPSLLRAACKRDIEHYGSIEGACAANHDEVDTALQEYIDRAFCILQALR